MAASIRLQAIFASHICKLCLHLGSRAPAEGPGCCSRCRHGDLLAAGAGPGPGPRTASNAAKRKACPSGRSPEPRTPAAASAPATSRAGKRPAGAVTPASMGASFKRARQVGRPPARKAIARLAGALGTRLTWLPGDRRSRSSVMHRISQSPASNCGSADRFLFVLGVKGPRRTFWLLRRLGAGGRAGQGQPPGCAACRSRQGMCGKAVSGGDMCGLGPLGVRGAGRARGLGRAGLRS
jgi:hypothetical protein